MHSRRNDYLRREIKRRYKFYTGERNDGTATLLDVVELFNISVDASRLDDYVIKSIDFKIPSIEVLDTKNNILYSSQYTANADLFNSFGGDTKFINVIITGNDYRIESLYWIDSSKPIITKMTFNYDDYGLSFIRERKNDINLCSTDGFKFSVVYSTDVETRSGRIANQRLLTKIFKKDGIYTKHFEHLYTYGDYYIPIDGMRDNYTFIEDGNVIYGIINIDKKGLCQSFSGICFENMGVDDVRRYLPLDMRISNFPGLTEGKASSAIVFSGWTEYRKHHFLEIYKYDDVINVKYQRVDNNHQQVTDTLLNIKLGGYKSVNITSEGIEDVISVLEAEFSNNGFISVTVDQLREFQKRMNIRSGILEEEIDPLSPKLLIDKSFTEIFDLVSTNKKDYFELVSEQFREALDFGDVSEKNRVKTFQKENNNQ